ncbi:MAG TPA: sigma-70 family RNA polymerase sigma factor [Thermoanaerobaculia bacterium]|nr:sigma-70 family RNA polymerase sigma factor [Thermoanaerobaculia bacterium]
MQLEGTLIASPFGAAVSTAAPRRPERPMDEAAFEAFYRKTAGGIWSYIYRMTGDAAMADDLLQKTFFRFLRSNPSIADDDHLRRYVYKTATNLVFDHFRETKRDRIRAYEWTPAEARPDRGDLRHDMARVFADLKPQERALLWLAHVEGNSHEEIGEAIGVKAKSVKVMLFRARKRLGEMLTKKGLAPEVTR